MFSTIRSPLHWVYDLRLLSHDDAAQFGFFLLMLSAAVVAAGIAASIAARAW
jgi:hypothetical protein